MGLLLAGLPDPVASQVQAPAAQEPDVIQHLAEGEDPFLCPDGPAFGFLCGLGGEPDGNSYDSVGAPGPFRTGAGGGHVGMLDW